MTQTLNGQVAVITGASSGIGEATAYALAREGARVVLSARRVDRLRGVAQRIHEQGGESLEVQTDVTDYAQAQHLVQAAREHFGKIDILINNAGVMLLGRLVDANIEDWQRMVNINLLGLMYTTHEVLPLMLEQGNGHIVNVSSVAGRVARMGAGVYNATKFAVGAFSESLRQEVTARHIRVTLIEPGAVNTELTDHITDTAAKQEAEQMRVTVHALSSEDIADTIVFALTRPPYVSVNELLIRPTEQER